MKKNGANSAMLGISTFTLFLVVYLVSPKVAVDCPGPPPDSRGTCAPVNSTIGKTTFTCSGAPTISCSASPFSFPSVLLPLGIVVSVATAMTYLLIGSKKGR
jgi:hypothetical protein